MSEASPSGAVSTETAPRMNRRQAAKVRTRQKVLDAARALFAERGYDPATIRDIAKGAGMSTGAVFANFQDKAELFEAVLTEDLQGAANVLREGASREAPVRDRLVNAFTAGYHASLEQLPLVQAVVARSWFQPAEAEARLRGAFRALPMVAIDTLETAKAHGELKTDADARLLGELAWAAYLSNFRRAAYEGWDVDTLSDHVGRQIDAILAGALNRQ
jgi:AcrR family transcriptional regulator